jgi:hypothetical protein
MSTWILCCLTLPRIVSGVSEIGRDVRPITAAPHSMCMGDLCGA